MLKRRVIILPQINFSEEELLALNELRNHFEDYWNWFYDVMFEEPEDLRSALKKISGKAYPIIEKLNQNNTSTS